MVNIYLLNGEYHWMVNIYLLNGEYLFIEWWIPIYGMVNTYLWNDEYLFLEWWIPIYGMVNTYFLNGEYLFMEWWIPISWMVNIYLFYGEYLFIEWLVMTIHCSPLFTIINNKKINLIHNGEYLFIEWWIPTTIDNLFQSISIFDIFALLDGWPLDPTPTWPGDHRCLRQSQARAARNGDPLNVAIEWGRWCDLPGLVNLEKTIEIHYFYGDFP